MSAPIRYLITDCRLGRLLVAASEQGVTTVGLGSNDGGLEAEFRRKCPHAALSDDGQLAEWSSIVLDIVDGKEPAEALPLDVPGTGFQWQVWRELMQIPYGDTRTYGEIAGRLGNPGAARAVGRACATNPVALVIPCHRAVSSGHKLHGFRGGLDWGMDHKARLLHYERSRTAKTAGQISFLDGDD